MEGEGFFEGFVFEDVEDGGEGLVFDGVGLGGDFDEGGADVEGFGAGVAVGALAAGDDGSCGPGVGSMLFALR